MLADKVVVGACLRTEREERGWSREALAARFRSVGEKLPGVVSLAHMIKEWEAGKHGVSDRYQALYCRVFGIQRAVLFGAESQEPDSSPASTVDIDARARDEWNDDMYRRAAMQLFAALSAGAAIPAGALETVLSGLERTLGDRAELDLGEWEETAWEYGRYLVTVPSAQLITDLAVDVVEIRQALDRARSPLVRDGLRRVSAQLSAGLAMAFHNLGEFRASRRSWRTARHAADASGDRDLRVWVRAREAQNAMSGNRPIKVAVDLTDDAINLADNAPSVGLAQAYANRAYLSVRQGDAARARMALRSLDNVSARLLGTSDEDQSSPWTWPESVLRHVEGSIYARLGDPVNAEMAIGRALTLYPPGRRLARAQVELDRAVHLVNNGHVRDGVDHALMVLETLPEEHRATIMIRNADNVIKALPDDKARELPAVRELHALTAGNTV